MAELLAPPEVVAALIAGVVATIGVIVSIYIARHQVDVQVRLKTQELEAQAQLKSQELEAQGNLKARELQVLASQLRAEQESVRQEQLTEILRKRIETYPVLYEIITVYGRNWEIEGKSFDHRWARSFLKALIDNNAKNGAFFSKRVYEWYGLLRTSLEDLSGRLAAGGVATREDIERLYDIIRGPILPSGDERDPGLGSYIKDELGSYVTLIVSATHGTMDTSKDAKRAS